MTDLSNITLYVPLMVLNRIQDLIKRGVYKSRSQIVRVCLKQFLDKEEAYMEDLKRYPEKKTQTIITTNIERRQIKQIKKISGKGGSLLYPSRSELVRVALREFIMKENHMEEDDLFKPKINNVREKLIEKLLLNKCGLCNLNTRLKLKGFVGICHDRYVKEKQKLIDSLQIEILQLKSGEIIEIITGE